jgi:PEP-CTERM motif
MKFSIFRILTVFVLVLFALPLISRAQAVDPIISVQSTGQTCIQSSNGICTDYTAVNGQTNPLVIGTGGLSSGLYVITNNTGSAINSISFTWSGMMAQNQFMSCQFGGGEPNTAACTVTSSGGGSGSGTTKYSLCPGQPNCEPIPPATGSTLIGATGTFTWSGFTSVAAGSNFDISFSSWANGDTQTPTVTPEPASMLLFGTGLLAVGGVLRRRLTGISA